MRVMKRPGQMFAEVEVTRHIMTKNMWEYYLEEPDENGIAFGVVMGFDTELGYVDMEEIAPYIISSTENMDEIMPASGWNWA